MINSLRQYYMLKKIQRERYNFGLTFKTMESNLFRAFILHPLPCASFPEKEVPTTPPDTRRTGMERQPRTFSIHS